MTTLLDITSNTLSGNSLFVLAESSRSSVSVPMFYIVLYTTLIVLGMIILIFIILKTRHWILDNGDSDENSENGGFFSIAQLRELRDHGALSDEEYESAKRVLVAQSLAMLSRSAADK